MPYWLNTINETPNEAIEKARNDTIERAKDIWGLDYAESSDGLYPAGNQIGRTQFRPDMCRAETFNVAPAQTNGGQWRTMVNVGAAPPAAMVTDANGWGTFFDFVLDEDVFIIIEGVFSVDTTPTIREVHNTLSGVSLPIMQIEEIYENGEDIQKGYVEVPVVVSPKSEYQCRVRSSAVGGGLDEAFGPLGEAIGKRSFLIRELY